MTTIRPSIDERVPFYIFEERQPRLHALREFKTKDEFEKGLRIGDSFYLVHGPSSQGVNENKVCGPHQVLGYHDDGSNGKRRVKFSSISQNSELGTDDWFMNDLFYNGRSVFTSKEQAIEYLSKIQDAFSRDSDWQEFINK